MTNALSFLAVPGRILIALMFVLSGIDKVLHSGNYVDFMASGGLPSSAFIIILVGLFEIVAGLAVATGYWARTAALLLAGFTLVASFLYHPYWALPGDQQMTAQLLFMKNMAVIGGLLMLVALGPGPGSLGPRSTSSNG